MPRRLCSLACLIAVACCAGCGGSSTPPVADCAAVAGATLGQVAQHIYHQAERGRDMAAALVRLTRSASLRTAVAAGSPSAVAAAAAPLLQRQIVALRIRGASGATLYAYQAVTRALAPRSGVLRDAGGQPIGSFTLSVLSDNAYVGLTAQVTGAIVAVHSATAQLAGNVRNTPAQVPARGQISYGGRTLDTYSFAGRSFPAGPMRVSLLIAPPPASACSSSSAQVVANTLGRVARNIYAQELHSGYVSFALRAYQQSAALTQAVRRQDQLAAGRAVDAVYARHIHVVRVQVRAADGALLADHGVRYALAPVHGTLPGGGQIAFSEQDDLGFGTLVHRFTGAAVILRVGPVQLPGSTLSPGPATLPDSGAVDYDGRSYRVYSFDVRGFPSGTVRATVLVAGS